MSEWHPGDTARQRLHDINTLILTAKVDCEVED